MLLLVASGGANEQQSNNLLVPVTDQHCHADGDCDGETKTSQVLSGHLQPLGSHKDPMIDMEEFTNFLPPETFRDSFIQTSTPAVFRQVLHPDQMAIFLNDTRLGQLYGKADVTVEEMKKERRGGPARGMLFKEFLAAYNSSTMYLADVMPSEMKKEWTIPAMLLCGGIPEHIQQVRLWFSSGGTSSVLHVDSSENLHCLVDGVKRFVLIHKDDRERIGMDRLSDGSFTMDVDRVDMTKFNMARVDWWNVTLEAGDCMYIPELWLHQVRSFGRNLAITVWWKDLGLDADRSDCDSVSSKFDCHDGNPDNCGNGIPASEIIQLDETTYLREVLEKAADSKGHVSKEDFIATLASVWLASNEESAEQVFNILDSQQRGFMVPAEDLTQANMEAVSAHLMTLDGDGEMIPDPEEPAHGSFPPQDGINPMDDFVDQIAQMP